MTTSPPTARSVLAGFVLALLLCAVNSYLTLSFGVIEEGPTIAALFFFAFFFLSSRAITTTEMGMVATMGSAGGSLGFITNFFAAEAMVGSPYTFWQRTGFAVVTSLVGMTFVIPLRQMLILRESLPWPGSKATESVIRALVEKGDPRQPIYLALACIGCIVWVVLNTDGGFGLVPDGLPLDIAGLGAFGLGVALSPFAIGGAYLMGLRVGVGFLVGAIVLIAMAPSLPEPSAPNRYVWPGIGFLLASGLTQMALNWRVLVDSLRGMLPQSSASLADVDADPILSGRGFVVFGLVTVLVTAVFGALGLGLSPLVVIVLIVVAGFVQNVIATRAAAQTAFNPARVMGVLLQAVTAMTGAPTPGHNLAGAGFVAGSGAQAGNLAGDLVYGRALGIPSRWQFWGQFATILPCALVSSVVFEQLEARGPMTIDGDGLAAPIAKMWAATAQVFAGTAALPPFAVEALAIGAIIGVLYVLFEHALERVRPESAPAGEGVAPLTWFDFVPHSTGIGIGLVLPPSFDLAFFVGAILLWVVCGRGLRMRDVTLTTIAVGSIVGEGIGGVAKPLLQLAGLIQG